MPNKYLLILWIFCISASALLTIAFSEWVNRPPSFDMGYSVNSVNDKVKHDGLYIRKRLIQCYKKLKPDFDIVPIGIVVGLRFKNSYNNTSPDSLSILSSMLLLSTLKKESEEEDNAGTK